jgi:hypothetical protein
LLLRKLLANSANAANLAILEALATALGCEFDHVWVVRSNGGLLDGIKGITSQCR